MYRWDFFVTNFAQLTLHKNIYNSSSGNMAVQQTVATVLHAAVALMLEGLGGTWATVRQDRTAVTERSFVDWMLDNSGVVPRSSYHSILRTCPLLLSFSRESDRSCPSSLTLSCLPPLAPVCLLLLLQRVVPWGLVSCLHELVVAVNDTV